MKLSETPEYLEAVRLLGECIGLACVGAILPQCEVSVAVVRCSAKELCEELLREDRRAKEERGE